ncbi:hypothetical protein LEMLEM_LOCUS19491 [Lemmus lemmus]
MIGCLSIREAQRPRLAGLFLGTDDLMLKQLREMAEGLPTFLTVTQLLCMGFIMHCEM